MTDAERFMEAYNNYLYAEFDDDPVEAITDGMGILYTTFDRDQIEDVEGEINDECGEIQIEVCPLSHKYKLTGIINSLDGDDCVCLKMEEEVPMDTMISDFDIPSGVFGTFLKWGMDNLRRLYSDWKKEHKEE